MRNDDQLDQQRRKTFFHSKLIRITAIVPLIISDGATWHFQKCGRFRFDRTNFSVVSIGYKRNLFKGIWHNEWFLNFVIEEFPEIIFSAYCTDQQIVVVLFIPCDFFILYCCSNGYALRRFTDKLPSRCSFQIIAEQDCIGCVITKNQFNSSCTSSFSRVLYHYLIQFATFICRFSTFFAQNREFLLTPAANHAILNYRKKKSQCLQAPALWINGIRHLVRPTPAGGKISQHWDQ